MNRHPATFSAHLRSFGLTSQRARRVLAKVCAFVLLSAAEAATYYVSTTGNDANPGTEAAPWRTVQKAANTMVAGDTVNIAPGTYAEMVTETTSGTAALPIIYQAAGYNPAAPTINTSVVVGGFALSSAHVRVLGMKLNGAGAPSLQGAVRFNSGSASCLLSDLEIECTAGGSNGLGGNLSAVSMTFTNPQPDSLVIRRVRVLNPWYIGVVLIGNNHLLENCYFSGTARSTAEADAIRTFGDNIVIRGNEIRGWRNYPGGPAHLDLIQTYSLNGLRCQNLLIENNVFADCPDAQIFMFEDQALNDSVRYITFRNNIFKNIGFAGQSFVKDTLVYNNLFYRCGTNTGHPLLFRRDAIRNGADNSRAFNNIFIECGATPSNTGQGWYLAAVSGTEAVANFQADHNLVIGTGAGLVKTGFQANGREANGLNGVDPVFVNAAAEDFRPHASSPVLGAGSVLNALFTADRVGSLRGAAWEIGPLEYTGAPQNARVRVQATQ